MRKKHLEDLLTDVSFVRWVRDEASPEETLKWDSWLQGTPENQRLADEAKEVIAAFQEEIYEIPVVSREWKKLKDIIEKDEGQIRIQEKRERRNSLWKSRSLVVTALLIIGICLGVFAFYQIQIADSESNAVTASEKSMQEYKTDYGEKATFRMSDNSKIVLNANSSIQFSSIFKEGLNTTEVWLNGEAWFDITHLEGEQQRIFTVHTNDASVQVLGTRFAVKTFESETRAVLEEGKIEVKLANELMDSNERFVIKPGEMVMFSSDKEELTLEKVNTRIFTSWKDDTWFFENTPLHEVARRIEDTFGVDVEIRDELGNRKLSGSIKSTNLEVIREALAKILDVSIEQKGEVLLIGINHTTQH